MNIEVTPNLLKYIQTIRAMEQVRRAGLQPKVYAQLDAQRSFFHEAILLENNTNRDDKDFEFKLAEIVCSLT